MELIGLKSLKMRLMKPLKEWMLTSECSINWNGSKKCSSPYSPLQKCFSAIIMPYLVKLYSQRKDILKKDLIFPSGSKRHVPNVACIASIFHWVIVRKFDWEPKMEEGGWEGKKTKLSFLPSPSPTPFPFIPSFCSCLTFSTQAILDGELDRDRFKGRELKPGQSSHRYSRKKMLQAIFSALSIQLVIITHKQTRTLKLKLWNITTLIVMSW